MAMLTLRDAMTMAQQANTPAGRERYNEGVLGGYVMSPEQAAVNQARKATGRHMKDNGGTGGILASGKTLSHPTYSDESPYEIGLAATAAGHWTPDGKVYIPANDNNLKYLQNQHFTTAEKASGARVLPRGLAEQLGFNGKVFE
jgi:hypothetical protein